MLVRKKLENLQTVWVLILRGSNFRKITCLILTSWNLRLKNDVFRIDQSGWKIAGRYLAEILFIQMCQSSETINSRNQKTVVRTQALLPESTELQQPPTSTLPNRSTENLCDLLAVPIIVNAANMLLLIRVNLLLGRNYLLYYCNSTSAVNLVLFQRSGKFVGFIFFRI